MQRIAPEKWGWLPWRGMSAGRFCALSFLGIWIGVMLTTTVTIFDTQPPIVRHNAAAVIYNGWVGLIEDRTRTDYCDVHPSRIMFENAAVNGEDIPVVLQLGSQGLVWPYLGHSRFMLMLMPASQVPPGVWNIVESGHEACHWWDFFTGGREVVYDPVRVVVP
jgi:hypothetical protein